MRLASLYRYPLKGLSPERLASVDLRRGDYLPGDRVFAVENGPSGFDAGAPAHQPKIKFLTLMRNESLARLRTRLDDATGELVIEEGGHERARDDLATREGRLAVEAFFRRFMPWELRGPPKVLAARDRFRFTDSRKGYVSLINLASVSAIEGWVGAPVNPLRFRGNLHVEGLEPFGQFDLPGQVLRSGTGVHLKVTKRIERCAATNVDPGTGLRDLAIPKLLMSRLGHFDCGVYAEILGDGSIADGARLTVEEPAQAPL
jgi:uncharacterized protein